MNSNLLPNMTVQRAIDEVPMMQLWALRSWAIENSPFSTAERASEGYVAQEIGKKI